MQHVVCFGSPTSDFHYLPTAVPGAREGYDTGVRHATPFARPAPRVDGLRVVFFFFLQAAGSATDDGAAWRVGTYDQ